MMKVLFFLIASFAVGYGTSAAWQKDWNEFAACCLICFWTMAYFIGMILEEK